MRRAGKGQGQAGGRSRRTSRARGDEKQVFSAPAECEYVRELDLHDLVSYVSNAKYIEIRQT